MNDILCVGNNVERRVAVVTRVTCSVPNCGKTLEVSIEAVGTPDQIESHQYGLGVARGESDAALYEKAHSERWYLDIHHTFCPSHIQNAAFAFLRTAVARPDRDEDLFQASLHAARVMSLCSDAAGRGETTIDLSRVLAAMSTETTEAELVAEQRRQAERP